MSRVSKVACVPMMDRRSVCNKVGKRRQSGGTLVDDTQEHQIRRTKNGKSLSSQRSSRLRQDKTTEIYSTAKVHAIFFESDREILHTPSIGP